MRTILIDADIVAYKVSVRNQADLNFGDTGTAQLLDHDTAMREVNELIAGYAYECKADKIVVCLSDPKVNFRKQLEPTYKDNRKDVVKPVLLDWIKEYLAAEYQSFMRPRLEADDVMGILATSGDRFIEGRKMIVSEDKDMRTSPAWVYNPNKADLGILKISKHQAKLFHLWQTLTGDQTDGYPGCKGIGPASPYAEDIISAARPLTAWDTVIEAYATKGKTEDDAIHQARLARILWADDYNFKTKGIRLWNPTCLLW